MLITAKINIDPIYLDKNIKNHIYDIIDKEYKNKCFKEYGYIININNIISISENYISNTNNKIIFNVLFDVLNLKLNINDEIDGKILYLDKNCILYTITKVNDKAKVVIPSNLMKNYIYNDLDKSYIYKSNNSIISKYTKGDTIKGIIINLRYVNNNFDYIASLKE